MKKYTRALLFFVFVSQLFIQATRAQEAPPIKPKQNDSCRYVPAGGGILVYGVEFGIINKSLGAINGIMPGRFVPLVVGQEYGWTMQLLSATPQVNLIEEFTLPMAPPSWGYAEHDPGVMISADRRTATTRRLDTVNFGRLFNFWTVVAGDPPGEHRIAIFINDVRVCEFTFEVR